MATSAHLVPATETSHFQPVLRHAGRAVRILTTGLDHWHLLSLDAPTVAMLWTWFLARVNHIPLPPAATAAMGMAVWMVYAADRLLDSRTGGPSAPSRTAELEARHHFHRRHQRAFRLALFAVAIALTALLPRLAPQAMRLYLILGALLLGYFVLIHFIKRSGHRLPKEIAVGVFFAAAIFIPTIARAPALRVVLLPGALLFAVLCSLNCLFIYAWEHPVASPRCDAQPHAATQFSLRFLPHLGLVSILAGLTLAIAGRSLPGSIPAACVLATCLLLLLHRNRRRFAPTTLRAAADLCLLTPLLLSAFLRH